jgi:outer membrane protein
MRALLQPTRNLQQSAVNWSSRPRIPFRGSIIRLVAATFLLWLAPGIYAQQAPQPSPLTLQQAVRIALEKNPQRKAALADTKAASADVRQAKSFLFPRVDFSETAMSGNDPVYVFGSKLRQQRFTSADFALNVLNTPTPYSNFATRFGGAWNLFDSFGSWHRIAGAQHMNEAATNQMERTDQEIVFRVVDAYYRVLLAQKQLQVAEQAVQTARAILERSKNRYESGVVVESDLLSAQVRVASRKQELIETQNALALARAQLSVSMGVAMANEFEPTDTLAEKNLPPVSLEDIEKTAVELRPDLKRVRSEEQAQQQNVAIAKSAFGPRVNGFADWELDNPNVASGGGNNWLAGVQIQIDLFQGGAKRAQLAHEKAVQEKVAAVKEMATDAVRLEVRRAFYDHDAARQQLDVVHASIADSQESLRINQNRYDSGLSTITDLLASEEAARRTQTDYWEALYRYYASYANLELASGTLNSQSVVVMP